MADFRLALVASLAVGACGAPSPGAPTGLGSASSGTPAAPGAPFAPTPLCTSVPAAVLQAELDAEADAARPDTMPDGTPGPPRLERPGPAPLLLGGLGTLQRRAAYPAALRPDGPEGEGIVGLDLGLRAEILRAEVVRGLDPRLDAEALRVVRAARFGPASGRGRPVPARCEVPVVFLRDRDAMERASDARDL